MPREELREAIYEAAIAAFRARGYAKATVDEITARAGVAKGTFFNFFPAKAAALAAYYWSLDAEIAPWRAALDAAAPIDSLARYAAKVERLFQREGSLIFDLLNETAIAGAMREMDERSGESDAREFAAFFERCKAKRTVRAGLDTQKAAELFIDLWAGAIRVWHVRKGKASLAKILRPKVELLFEGVGR